MEDAPQPAAVLECGCLWDGKLLDIDPACTVADHGLGSVPYVKRRVHVDCIPLDPTWIPLKWPDPDGKWIGAEGDE